VSGGTALAAGFCLSDGQPTTACEHVRVEGRALKREPGKQWAWLVPWWAVAVGNVVGASAGAPRVSMFLAGVAAGVVWQLLFRRDLTSRLTVMAVLVTVGVVGALVARQEFVWRDMDRGGLYAIGILLGLIYTEHYQRWRDRGFHWRPSERVKAQDEEVARP